MVSNGKVMRGLLRFLRVTCLCCTTIQSGAVISTVTAQQMTTVVQSAAGAPAEAEIDAAATALRDPFFREAPDARGEYPMDERGIQTWTGPWRTELGSVDLRVFREQVPYKGANAIDLNGTRSGSVFQPVELVLGQTYTISFLAAGNWTTNADQPRKFSVWLGTEPMHFTLQPGQTFNPDRPDWRSMSATFTAKTIRSAVRFRSENPGYQHGTLITRVKMGLASVTSPSPPAALGTLQVPLPSGLTDYIADRNQAIALGKALFWDIQAGSDGQTACASCHWNAGADIRTRHTVNPGAIGSAFEGKAAPNLQRVHAISAWRGNNVTLQSSDFPFQKLPDPLSPANEPGFEEYANAPVFSSKEIVGSQGVILADFAGIQEGVSADLATPKADPLFNRGSANLRQITGRNSPTNINAVFLDRLFWDGRANHYFNGVNAWGDMDPNARVLKSSPTGGAMVPVRILLNNAALASQAVAPVLSDVEMSWTGRKFPELARKLFSLRPLAQQHVASDDSVLGPYVSQLDTTGLAADGAGYAQLVRGAFRPEWWASQELTPDGYTQMESNFSLFWGLSLLMYQATLVSDQTPFDAWVAGDAAALSPAAQRGLQIFLNEGACINCHGGPQFAGGTVNSLPGPAGEAGVEQMEMARGMAWYDSGFYNIGVRPTEEDIGLGAEIPGLGPISYSRREQRGQNPDPSHVIRPGERVAVNGAFKTPSLRNVELTGPYMHNGGFRTLEEVVQFYVRGADFFHTNIDDLDPDVAGIPSLRSDPEGIAALVEFMEHLTDDRVRYQSAPFDHPELPLPTGHELVVDGSAPDRRIVLPATGAGGGRPLQTFASALENASPVPVPSQTITPAMIVVPLPQASSSAELNNSVVPAAELPLTTATGPAEVAVELPQTEAAPQGSATTLNEEDEEEYEGSVRQLQRRAIPSRGLGRAIQSLNRTPAPSD